MRLDILMVIIAVIGGLVASVGLVLPYTGYSTAVIEDNITADQPAIPIQSPTSFGDIRAQRLPIVILVNSVSGALSNVSVYSDNELKGLTDSNGILIFEDILGQHSIGLKGAGFEKNDTVYTDKQNNTLKYKVDRKFTLVVKVKQIYLNDPVKNALVEIDGKVEGATDAEGRFAIENMDEGQHEIEVSYNGFSEDRTVNLDSEKTLEIEMVTVREKTAYLLI